MNFLSMLNGSKFLIALIFLAGCQSLRTREDVRQLPPGRPQAPTPAPRDEVSVTTEVPETPPPPPVIPSMPKLGIILGGGGARTYAHIGFLQELAKMKVPVSAIGGIEFAAPMAALYAKKELANDVEWQMFKLKDEDILRKSLLGGTEQNSEVTVLREFIHTSFARANLQDFRIPFACPSLSLAKNQVYLMNRGGIDQVLYSCMAYPPFFRPYSGNISAVRDVSALAAHLRQRGANFIVFVNVLPPPAKKGLYGSESSTENVLWGEIAGSYNKPFIGVDAVVSLDVGDYGIMDFSRRREIMNKGSDSAAKLLKTLTRKWGF